MPESSVRIRYPSGPDIPPSSSPEKVAQSPATFHRPPAFRHPVTRSWVWLTMIWPLPCGADMAFRPEAGAAYAPPTRAAKKAKAVKSMIDRWEEECAFVWVEVWSFFYRLHSLVTPSISTFWLSPQGSLLIYPALRLFAWSNSGGWGLLEPIPRIVLKIRQ